ncbi:MAG: hypothetical protein IPP77_11620 [Bacteroidetes bacterium]|nr:hypothetical protein [Bacteroidota bacterium]
MKKLLLLFVVALIGTNVSFAQDDELPPPSSKPQIQDTSYRSRNTDGFRSFKKKKKIDLSKFIIEPNFNFSIGQGRIDAGLSPYVGYNVWKGLCLGGGITYFYTGFSGIIVTDAFGNQVGSAKARYHTYGGGVFAQYNIWRGFFARTRFEVLHRDLSDLNTSPVPKTPITIAKGFISQKCRNHSRLARGRRI